MRLVLDTNVVVSVLLFGHGSLSWIMESWRSGQILPIISEATSAELKRVLSYPRFNLDSIELQTALDAYFEWAEEVDVAVGLTVPNPRDPTDPPLPGTRDCRQRRRLGNRRQRPTCTGPRIASPNHHSARIKSTCAFHKLNLPNPSSQTDLKRPKSKRPSAFGRGVSTSTSRVARPGADPLVHRRHGALHRIVLAANPRRQLLPIH